MPTNMHSHSFLITERHWPLTAKHSSALKAQARAAFAEVQKIKSRNQKSLFWLLARNKSTKEAAAVLDIKYSTAATYIDRLCERFGFCDAPTLRWSAIRLLAILEADDQPVDEAE